MSYMRTLHAASLLCSERDVERLSFIVEQNTDNTYKTKIIMSEPKKMERPRTGRMLAGVCAAIANYVNMDATVVRIIYL